MNVQRYIIMLVLAIALTVVGFSVSATETETDDFVPQTAEEKAWLDYVHQEIDKKLFEAYDDGMAAFGIDKEKYAYYDLHVYDEEIKELPLDSARDLMLAVFRNVLGDDKDIKPGLFINQEDPNEAFVLFKANEDGKNYIYWFQKDESADTWSLTKKDVKEGKILEPLKMQTLAEYKASHKASRQE